MPTTEIIRINANTNANNTIVFFVLQQKKERMYKLY